MVRKTGPHPGWRSKEGWTGVFYWICFEGWGIRTKFPEKKNITFLCCLDEPFEQSGAIEFKKGSLRTWQCIGHLGMIWELPRSTTQPLFEHAGQGHRVFNSYHICPCTPTSTLFSYNFHFCMAVPDIFRCITVVTVLHQQVELRQKHLNPVQSAVSALIPGRSFGWKRIDEIGGMVKDHGQIGKNTRKNWQWKQVMPDLKTWSYSAKICQISKSLTPRSITTNWLDLADSKQPGSLAQYQHSSLVGSAEDHGVEAWFNQSSQLGDSDNQRGSCSNAWGVIQLGCSQWVFWWFYT